MNGTTRHTTRNGARQLRTIALTTVALLVAAACGSGDDGASTAPSTSQTTTTSGAPATTVTTKTPETTTATATTQPTTTTTTTPTPEEVEDAQSVVDDYFVAYNAHSEDAVLALLAADATFILAFGDPSSESEEMDADDWGRDLEKDVAQGTVLSLHTCSVAASQPEDGTRLSCEYGTLDAPTQAAAAAPHVPTTTRFTVTSAGAISEIHNIYGQEGQPDFLHVGEHFYAYLTANHPDFQCLATSRSSKFVCDSDDLSWDDDDPRAEGLLVAEYAEKWRVHLVETGCSYDDRFCD